MEVILPCAGASTRFPNMRPKYLLTDYKSRLMIESVIAPYAGRHAMHMIILQEHDERYHVTEMIGSIFGSAVSTVVLPAMTSGPAETVAQGIASAGINPESPILIRDCDSFFDHEPLSPANRVHVALLEDHPGVRNAGAKSYVITNDQGIITSIVEKNIVSNRFCVGGYQFWHAGDFLRAFGNLRGSQREPFISNCVDYLVSSGMPFDTQESSNWIDVGTAQDWQCYNNRPTIFCDIDGTVVANQGLWGPNGYGSEATVLPGNAAVLLHAQSLGCQLIFTTARPERHRKATARVLDGIGFTDYTLLMGLHHARRILINDHAPSNPYPSAVSINLERDRDNLQAMLAGLIG